MSQLLYFVTRSVVFAAFVLLVFQGEWVNAISALFIFILMMVPEFLKNKFETQTPIELDVAVSLFVFLTLYLGSFQDFYERIAWYDVVLHFFSGILLGMIGFVLVYQLNQGAKKTQMSAGFVSLFAVTFSMAISVVWEIFEFTVDSLLGFQMQGSGIPDTMGDFIVNMVGALIVAVVGYVWMKRRKIIPLTRAKIDSI